MHAREAFRHSVTVTPQPFNSFFAVSLTPGMGHKLRNRIHPDKKMSPYKHTTTSSSRDRLTSVSPLIPRGKERFLTQAWPEPQDYLPLHSGGSGLGLWLLAIWRPRLFTGQFLAGTQTKQDLRFSVNPLCHLGFIPHCLACLTLTCPGFPCLLLSLSVPQQSLDF